MVNTIPTASSAIFSYGYLGVAFLMAAGNLFPPIPSGVILPLAGFLVWWGDSGFVTVFGVSILGSLLGASILYALGRVGASAPSRRTARPPQWHRALPESVNRAPSTGTNRQS